MLTTAETRSPIFTTLKKNWRDFLPLCVLLVALPIVEPIAGTDIGAPPLVFYLVVCPAFFFCMVRALRAYLHDEAPLWQVAVGIAFFGFLSFGLSIAAVTAFEATRNKSKPITSNVLTSLRGGSFEEVSAA